MANPRVDPYRNFNFIVEIDGIAKAAFQEVCGLGAEVDVAEYREGGENAGAVRKLPGRVRYFPITLKRGITQDKSLWSWFKTVVNGVAQRQRLGRSSRLFSQPGVAMELHQCMA